MTDAINANATVLTFDAAEFAGEVKKMRDKTVAAHNSATPFARHALMGLVTGDLSEPKITASLLSVYKPISPKGKVGDKLSSLQYADGGDTARKAAEKVFSIYSVRECEGVMPLIRAFMLDAVGAPKSLNALNSQVADCVKAWADAEAEAAAKAALEAGEGEGEQSLDAPQAVEPDNAAKAAVDAIASVRAYLASGDVAADVVEQLQGLFADWQALSAPQTTVEQLTA